MKFATYKSDSGDALVGVLSRDGSRIFSLGEMGVDDFSMRELIAAYSDSVRQTIQKHIDKDDGGAALNTVTLEAPIPHPRNGILAVGLNYVEHAKESARARGAEYKKPAQPVYFTKWVDRCVGPDGPIPAHADLTAKLDYECELAVVIGKRCDRVRPEDAYDHIFGYTVANDVSARDLQTAHIQFAFAKGLNGFAPLGPWIVTRDEFATPPHLAVRTRVNGETRQDGNTADFIFDIPFIISQLSSGITLEAGDIVITGTPSGVGMGFEPPKFLKPGDVVECEIEGIGVLRNTVI